MHKKRERERDRDRMMQRESGTCEAVNQLNMSTRAPTDACIRSYGPSNVCACCQFQSASTTMQLCVAMAIAKACKSTTADEGVRYNGRNMSRRIPNATADDPLSNTLYMSCGVRCCRQWEPSWEHSDCDQTRQTPCIIVKPSEPLRKHGQWCCCG